MVRLRGFAVVERSIRRAYESAGLLLEIHNDMAKFIETKRSVRGLIADPCFNPLQSTAGPGNAFWVSGTDQEGEVVHLQALRVCDASSLHDELRARQCDYRPYEFEVCEDRSSFHLERDLVGALGYHGELWLREDWRARHMAPTLARLAIVIARARWQPDQMWSLVAEDRANQRYLSLIGYRRLAPEVYWVDQAGRVRLRDHVASISALEIDAMVRTLSRVVEKSHNIISEGRRA